LRRAGSPLEVELRLGQHPLEDVKAAADLLPVAGPVLPAELRRGDVSAHQASSVTGLVQPPIPSLARALLDVLQDPLDRLLRVGRVSQRGSG
jgi:hypothetical protein